MTGSSHVVTIDRIDGEQRLSLDDSVAVEEPLEIQIVAAATTGAAAKSLAITMRTPGDDFDLALGFLFTEGILASPDDVVAVESVGETDPHSGEKHRVRIEVKPSLDLDLDRLERHFYTTSSCGVCGKASIEALRVAGVHSLLGDQCTFDIETLHALPKRLRALQPAFSATGGLHAAGIFNSDGEIVVVREDVGRHNATDKVIGALFRDADLPARKHGILVSGRASFELVQKALVAGIPLLAAVGAPSSLAIQTAIDFDMTLVGFLRNGTFNIYANSQRVGNGSN